MHSGMDRNQYGGETVNQYREKGEEISLLLAGGERQSLRN